MSLTEPENPKGTPLPIPQFPVVGVLAVSLAFFLAALGEELGWSGYIIDPMEDRWGALQPPFSWGRCGPFGTSYHWCRLTGR
jgi:membrane protease YdiL (CAAX protease family)